MGPNQIIPVNRPRIPRKASQYLSECLTSGWISSEGPFVKKFESAFAKYLGASSASTTSSGTTALHLALLALGIKTGDEVIVPALTIASCYFAVWYTGAKAIPVDITADTCCLDPDKVEEKITKRTRAIMVVHLFGQPCEMESITKIARKYDLKIIEDAAEAHGAEYRGHKTGSLGDIAIFSFYANKIVTTGEGGMVVSNHQDLIAKVNKLKSLNQSKTRFIHAGVGYNYLMSNLQAALGLASLEEIEESLSYKRQMAELYFRRLGDIPGLILPTKKPGTKCVHWMFAVRIDPDRQKLNRDQLMQTLLLQYGVQTRTFFFSPRTAFKKLGLFSRKEYPVARSAEQTGFYLPSGLGNSREEFERVADALQQIYS